MNRPALTEIQERLFRFMANYFANHQRMPTLREIMPVFGWNSPNSVMTHLRPLVKKGYLRTDGGSKTRAYEIVGLSGAIAPVVAAHVGRMLGGSADNGSEQ